MISILPNSHEYLCISEKSQQVEIIVSETPAIQWTECLDVLEWNVWWDNRSRSVLLSLLEVRKDRSTTMPFEARLVQLTSVTCANPRSFKGTAIKSVIM